MAGLPGFDFLTWVAVVASGGIAFGRVGVGILREPAESDGLFLEVGLRGEYLVLDVFLLLRVRYRVPEHRRERATRTT